MFCACIGETTIDEAIETIKKAEKQGADLIELRIDFLDKEEKQNIGKIISNSKLPLIATNRGGNQKILIKAIKSGAKHIDMDINEIDKDVLNFAKNKKCKIILSYHNFENTPSIKRLIEISKQLNEQADIVKIITTSKTEKNNNIILSLYEKLDFPLIAFSMGKIGMQTRIDCLAHMHYALWTYCSVNEKKTATSQISLEQAKRTKLYCVIGNPISHSLSPIMHNENFKSLRMNARYVCVCVRNLKKYIKTLVLRGISGVNVTIPFKVEAMKYLDEIDDMAKKIGAINTIAIKNKKLIGYNTDATGALMAVKEKIKNIKSKKIVILGSGGAARGVYFAFKEMKANIIILARNKKKAEKIGKSLELNNQNLKTQLQDADILINCTCVGMRQNESLVEKKYLNKYLLVFDIVYNPIKTKLIKDAQSIGCDVVFGYKMLVYQGAESFKIWTGKIPDTRIMMNIVKNKVLPNIALIGFMGVGKTSVGKLLSEKLNRKFIDLDQLIEKKTKMPIIEIFKKFGESYFRKLEKEELKKTTRKNNSIISCGGGIVLDEENRNLLKKHIVVLLKARKKKIEERLKNKKDRPLLCLSKEPKITKINELMNKREKFYNLVADYSFDTDNLTPKELAEKIKFIFLPVVPLLLLVFVLFFQ